MIHLKKFQNHTAYETYVSTDYPKPNVSCCVQENEVHYNPIPLLCKLTLNNGSIVKLEGSGELTSAMISGYSGTCVSAEIGEACTSIGNFAFQSCSSLTSINIPSGVTRIGMFAFSDCTAMTTCTISNNSLLTSIGGSAFYGCSGLTSIDIPSGVTSISSNAFYGCSGLTSINIPNGVRSIGGQAFQGCTKLTSINIPSGVTSIGSQAFYGCRSLTSINIPSGVTRIDGYAFVGCSGLISVTINATTPPTLGSNAFNNTNNCPIYVPSGSVDTYETATNWSTYATRIQPIPTT